MSAKYSILGAAQTVTGSKHLLSLDGFNLLIDCGLFQGTSKEELLNWKQDHIHPKKIDAIVITHSHLDHIGYLPKLVRDGFHGKIYATAITKELAQIILKDAADIQSSDAALMLKKNKRDPRAKALYNSNDVTKTMNLFTPIFYSTPFKLGPFDISFYQAGHIPGSASIGIKWQDGNLLFSGDLGSYEDHLSHAPVVEDSYQNVVIEGTYGQDSDLKLDKFEEMKEALISLKNSGGSMLIASFAMARTQVLLEEINEVFQKFPELSFPIYLDSPMGIAINQVYLNNPDELKMNFKQVLSEMDTLTICDEYWKSERIIKDPKPKIIIASSGMLTGGRVLKHIEYIAPDDKNILFLPGFQAPQTLGRKLLEGLTELTLGEIEIPINAQVIHSGAFSAHANQKELITWLKNQSRLNSLILNHGEIENLESFKDKLSQEFPNLEIYIPAANQTFRINSKVDINQ